MITDPKFTEMAKLLKAMAHPTRLYILDKLHEKEHCVCELTELIGADISTVSKHLAVLRDAGLVGSSKNQNQVFYRLLCPCVLEFYSCVIGIKGDR